MGQWRLQLYRQLRTPYPDRNRKPRLFDCGRRGDGQSRTGGKHHHGVEQCHSRSAGAARSRRNSAAPADPNRKAATAPLLSKAIDWAIAENKRQGSKFLGKLDTANIAVMGHSCGGGLASQFGKDPRVKTIILWSAWVGRITNDEFRNRLKSTTLIISGDARYDISFYPALQAWEALRSTKTPVVYAWRTNMTHLGTYRQADGGELAPIGTAWLDWQLKGDQNAAKKFNGVECGLCNQLGWHVLTRNIN